jgi:TolB-like protein/Flp pilus assembly protein TadD
MFTDIVGYTSLMQKDENLALQTIERHRFVLEKYTLKYHGNIMHYYGDGSLSIFPSAFEAVECALDIQKELTRDPRVPLRIGIHLGDIKIQGESVFGDGVNVASRLESMGVAGSILITDTIYHLVRNQSEIRTTPLGNFRLKNVDHPVQVYALTNDFLSVPKSTEISGRIKSFPRKLTWIITITVILILGGYGLNRFFYFEKGLFGKEDKSIAVLPFENLSNDPQQEYFSDGITDDIINQLVKISALKVKSRTTTEQYKNHDKTTPVIGRELGVTYILEGSVRKAGNHVRIVAQLIDVSKDVHLWSETFDREITEIFTIQSEIAIEIAQMLETRLTKDERRHIRGEPAGKGRANSVTAYDYLLRARDIWRNWNDENDLDNALQLIEEAIETDPSYARAYVLKGRILHYGMRQYGVPTRIWIDQALDLANRAIEMDTTLADAYLLKGNILQNQDGKSEEALRNLKKAYWLEPGNPDVLQSLGDIHLSHGNYEKAASMIIRSIEREYSLKDPEYYFRWGNIFFMMEESEKAETYFLKATSLAPGWIVPYYRLGQLYRYQGNLEMAEKTLTTGLEIAPLDQETIDALGWVNLQAGDLQDAARYWSMYKEIEQQFSDSSQYVPFRHRLGYVRLLQGDTSSAINLIQEQRKQDIERYREVRGYGAWMSGGFYYDLATTNAYLGNREEALAWLDSAYQKGFINSWYLENDPLLANIRNDDQFRRIQAKFEVEHQKQINAFKNAIEENRALQQELERLPLNTNRDL